MTHGFIGAVFMASATCLIYVVLQLILYAQISGKGMHQPFWVARRSIVAVAVMSIWFVLGRPALGMIDELPIAIRLVIDIASGGVLYLGTHYATWRFEGMPDGVEGRVLHLLRQGLVRMLPSAV